MKEDLKVLCDLSSSTLHGLAASLREGPLSAGLSLNLLRQLIGPAASPVFTILDDLSRDGMAQKHIAVMLDTMAATKDRSFDPALFFELILSGPDLPGVPTGDTAATYQTLIHEAESEILLVGYAIYDGKHIFEPVAQKLKERQGLKATMCIDIPRGIGDTSLDSEIVNRFAAEFRKKHWPWEELPSVYYDPRALKPANQGRASLHAKCVVVDRLAALITSANFTEAAQRRNIELGLLVKYPPIAQRIVNYFEGLQQSNQLMQLVFK